MVAFEDVLVSFLIVTIAKIFYLQSSGIGNQESSQFN